MRFQQIVIVGTIVLALASCKKDTDPVIVVAASEGSRVQINGLIGTEAGSSAGNSVFLDLSTDKASAIARASWDLGFSGGSDFRVIINNTSSAGAKVLAKFDLAQVDATDTIGLTLAVSQSDPQPTDLAFFDDIPGDINKTVIPAVSVTDASNPVIILNRGTGGSIAPRPWIKLRVLRNGNGYSVQYARITETTFKTIQVTKDADYLFRYVSLENGAVEGQPTSTKWDLAWTYAVFETDFGDGIVPYNFSDLIEVNDKGGVKVAEKKYASAEAAAAAYTAFTKDSVAKTTLVTDRWGIGKNWRSTQPATGVNKDRFYLVKDAAGNYYKLKCIDMGVGGDGGTRGKPSFEYQLIK